MRVMISKADAIVIGSGGLGAATAKLREYLKFAFG
jgi:Asp/Glu/hydantoin racemase